MGAILGSIQRLFADLNSATGGWLIILLALFLVMIGVFGLYLSFKEKEKLKFKDFWPTLFFLMCLIVATWPKLSPKIKPYTDILQGKYASVCEKSFLVIGSESRLNLLLRLGFEINKSCSEDGAKVLHHAVQLSTPDFVTTLIENGANVHVVDKYGETPLHWVSHLGPVENLKILLENGADVNVRSSNGKGYYDFYAQPIHWAAYLGSSDKVLVLLEAGANKKTMTNRGKTAWDYAQENPKLLGTSGYNALMN